MANLLSWCGRLNSGMDGVMDCPDSSDANALIILSHSVAPRYSETSRNKVKSE